jgi:hypothetical protein
MLGGGGAILIRYLFMQIIGNAFIVLILSVIVLIPPFPAVPPFRDMLGVRV